MARLKPVFLALLASSVALRGEPLSDAQAHVEQDHDRVLLRGRSVERAARRRRSAAAHLRDRASRPIRNSRRTARRSRSPASTTATSTCSSCPRRRRAQAPHLASGADQRRGLDAGRQAHPLPLHRATITTACAGCSRCPPRAACPTRSRCRWPTRLVSRRTDRSSPTCRCPAGSRRGSAIAAAQTTPIWLASSPIPASTKCRATNSNDFNPMWIGDKVYFLSDRNGPVTLFSYDVNSKKVTQADREPRARYQVAPRPARRHRLRAVRLAQSLRSEVGQGADQSRSSWQAT